jgi:hypothetical protein
VLTELIELNELSHVGYYDFGGLVVCLVVVVAKKEDEE